MAKLQSAGSQLYISTSAQTGVTGTALAALAIADWTVVGELLSPGEFGKEYSDVAPTPAIGNRRQEHFKGSYDNGTLEFEVYFDPNDAGQSALKTALDSDDEWGFMIVLNDAATTAFFSRGPVMSVRHIVSDVNGMVTARVRIGLNEDILDGTMPTA